MDEESETIINRGVKAYEPITNAHCNEEKTSVNLIRKQLFEYICCIWKEIKDEAHLDLVKSVTNYIGRMNSQRTNQSFFEKPSPLNNCLIAAAILMGVNISDHKFLFEMLSEQICSSLESSLILDIFPATDLQKMQKSLIRQLNESLTHDFNDESDNEDVDERSVKKPIHGIVCLSEFCDQYEMRFNDVYRPPVVFFIREVEAHKKEILDILLLSLSNYVSRVPIFIVFGVATSVGAVHHLIGSLSSMRLVIETFRSDSPQQCLDRFLTKLLINDATFPFRLSGRILSFMRHIYFGYNFSMSNLLFLFKFILMDITSTDKCKYLKKYLQEISLPPERRSTLIKRVTDHYTKSSLAFRTLFSLFGDIPKTPLGSTLSELYTIVLEDKNWMQHDNFHAALDTLCVTLSTKEFETRILSAQAISPSAVCSEILLELKNQSNASRNPAAPAKNAFELQQRLRSLNNKKKDFRPMILFWLTELCQNLHPSDVPACEHFYYDELEKITRLITPSVRAETYNDLLQKDFSKTDISRLFEIYLTQGRTSSLYNWFMMFKNSVSGTNGANDDMEKELLIRFLNAVAELQILGFVKPSCRNSDVIYKLTCETGYI